MEELRARFLELAPDGFEESETADGTELAAYGEAAERVRTVFPDARVTRVADDWADRWREFHHAVTIGPLWVGPPWEAPPTGALAIVIDPGRAFGTGAHPSTRLCLELVLEQERGSLLDIGCGSGVISIAAAKLGFEPVTGIDVDAVAVEVTDANARANRVVVAASTVDATAEKLPPAELAVANISLALVEAVAERLRSPCVVTAGYLASDRPRLAGFDHAGHRELEGWGADVFVAVPPDAVPL